MRRQIDKKIINKRKKPGFTLIELIAVLAIMSVLFVIFTPKVIGYIKEAKKTKALNEVREVVMAVDSYNISTITNVNSIGDSAKYSEISSKLSEYIDCNTIKSIPDDLQVISMRAILNGSKEFLINDNDKISIKW